MFSPPLQPYPPTYDPLHTKKNEYGYDYAPSYWIDTAGSLPEDDGPIFHDQEVDVAIVGSGYTGLSCAIFLAQEHGIKATILEANRCAWGCSTRNGGQAQLASGRLKRSQWIKRYGLTSALALHREICEAMDVFKELIQDIPCDPQAHGHLYIAHKPSALDWLKKESEVLNTIFNYPTKILDANTIKNEYIGDQEAAGGLYEPEGIGIHAGKLAFGYIRKARALGVKIHPSSPVIECNYRDGFHYLKTPNGIVKAKAVGIATGGYTPQWLTPALKNRIFPILSNSLVTRKLTANEIAECNIRSTIFCTDTRILRHYYRLMPDGRMQIGSRSAISGKMAPHKKHEQGLINSLVKKFPILKNIELEYSWWGWVDISHDMMPRIFQPYPEQSLYYALGYGGNGVMYSAQAGRRLAQKIVGKPLPDIPVYHSELPFPNIRECIKSQYFSPFRRLGQWWLYRYYYLKDEVF